MYDDSAQTSYYNTDDLPSYEDAMQDGAQELEDFYLNINSIDFSDCKGNLTVICLRFGLMPQPFSSRALNNTLKLTTFFQGVKR